jgi:hypothetical protein
MSFDADERPPKSVEFVFRVDESAPRDIAQRLAWVVASVSMVGVQPYGRTHQIQVDVGHGQSVTVGMTLLASA